MLRFASILLFCLPLTAQAGLLDLLPLKRIERKLIYPLSPVQVDPVNVDLKGATEHVLNSNGEDLIVWSIPATGPTRAHLLYFQGNAGNLANRAERFKLMQSQGIHVIAMSYRGSSGSTGIPSEPAITQDALTLYQNLNHVIHDFKPKTLILYGESLGSAVAIALLAHLTQDRRPAGIILEAPFTSTPDMARAMADIPANLIAQISDRWDSLSRASALTIPTLIIHGTADEVTPIAMGRTLFSAIPTRDKDLIAVSGATHSATWRSDTMPKLWRFVRNYASP